MEVMAREAREEVVVDPADLVVVAMAMTDGVVAVVVVAVEGSIVASSMGLEEVRITTEEVLRMFVMDLLSRDTAATMT